MLPGTPTSRITTTGIASSRQRRMSASAPRASAGSSIATIRYTYRLSRARSGPLVASNESSPPCPARATPVTSRNTTPPAKQRDRRRRAGRARRSARPRPRGARPVPTISTSAEREAQSRDVPEAREPGLDADEHEPRHLRQRLAVVVPRALALRRDRQTRTRYTTASGAVWNSATAPSSAAPPQQHRDADDERPS